MRIVSSPEGTPSNLIACPNNPILPENESDQLDWFFPSDLTRKFPDRWTCMMDCSLPVCSTNQRVLPSAALRRSTETLERTKEQFCSIFGIESREIPRRTLNQKKYVIGGNLSLVVENVRYRGNTGCMERGHRFDSQFTDLPLCWIAR